MANRVFVPELATPPTVAKGAPFQLAGESMGTSWSVRGFAEAHIDLAAFERDIAQTLAAIVQDMSQWEPGSALSRFNASPKGSAAKLSPAFATVLACAQDVANATSGAFDPTLGALVDLWGFGPRAIAALPRDEDIAAALAASGWRKLAFDRAARTLVQPGGVRLDFAGIAKGFAVDAVAERATACGLHAFLVEIGGEVRGRGVKPDGQPWWVEIEQPPDCPTQPIVAALCDLSIATSGDYRRGAWIDGQRVSHTLDPRTGRPLQTRIAAVTVLHADCMWADAYATAFMVMGAEAGLAFADARDLEVIYTLRGDDGAEQIMSAAFKRQLES